MEAHILSAAMKAFNMASLEDEPSSPLFPEGSADLDPPKRREVLLLALREVLSPLVDLSFPTSPSMCDSDQVRAYAREVLSLGLMFLEFCDAVWEGDGLRNLRCWKFFLLLFKASHRTNYALEAFTPRMKNQLLWSRTVNTSGRPGHNIPCDLHMEHINRECKNAMVCLGQV